MEKKRFSRSLILLLELIGSIVLFALAAVVCVRVLVSARELSLRAEALDRGVETVTSAAELLRSSADEASALEALAQVEALEIQRRDRDGLVQYEFQWLYEGEILYSLELVRSREVAP